MRRKRMYPLLQKFGVSDAFVPASKQIELLGGGC